MTLLVSSPRVVASVTAVSPCKDHISDIQKSIVSNKYLNRYLEPWHSDVFEFLDLRKNHGKEEVRARDLFLGLWIPDLFMQRTFSQCSAMIFTQQSEMLTNH